MYDFIDIRTITNAFPLKIEKYKMVETVRTRILDVLKSVTDKVFQKIKNESLFFAVSIYPNFYDEDYYKKILVKHFLPFLNKNIMDILKEKGAKKALYFEYPEENMRSGNLNPIFPHHLITYGLFNEDRAEIVFGFTEEGVYIGRTFTADDPNFKKKIDEERPFKEFKSSISPKLTLIMLNFLNLFENREKKRILDPFVGNGTIPIFGLIQDFQMYGSDIEAIKVRNTIRNLQWVLEELEEPIPPLLTERFKEMGVSGLSNYFQPNFFDGICTEPSLGPFFREKPYYSEALEIIETQLEPLYNSIFRETYNILKSLGRICIIAPIITTADGGEVQINISRIAENNNFRLIPMIEKNRIVNKSNIRLQIQQKYTKSLIDAKKGQVLKRKIYVFEKQE